MNARGSRRWIGNWSGGLWTGLAIAAAFSLGGARLGRAQSRPAESASAPEPSSAHAPGKGLNTGIQVHGHWVIEVKNPNGSVVRHVEFENSLITPNSFTGPSLTGSQALVALLSGNASVVANTGYSLWTIELASLSGGDTSPCTTANLIGLTGVTGIPGTSGTVFSAPAGCNIPTPTVTPSAGTAIAAISTSNGTQTISSALPTQLTIAGSVQAAQAGTVDAVFTIVQLNSSFSFPFTYVGLPQQSSGTCGGANQPPCAVSVAAGQTVAVTVTISFS